MLVDQQTDKSQRVLLAIKDVLADSDLKALLGTISPQETYADVPSKDFVMPGQRIFPVNDRNNVILSKIYFDHQKADMSADQATTAEAKLDVYLNLHDIPDSIFTRKVSDPAGLAKEASQPIVLLPILGLCKIACQGDLQKAADLFIREHQRLPMPERIEFSKNFVKAAEHFQVKGYPPAIAKYASALDTDLGNTRYLLELRASAAKRAGKPGDKYLKLASQLGEVSEAPDKEDLIKLAELLYLLDKENGFDVSHYDSRIPCAYSVVFNKVAESDPDANEQDAVDSLSKAQIVARYGQEALEEVEDEDGAIDRDKLREVIKLTKGHLG